MFYFLINVHIYILLSKASVIEGRPGVGVLARICFSGIHAKWCHFRQYLWIHVLGYYASRRG